MSVTYCTREDLEKRLTAAGIAYCADDDLDGMGEQDNVNATDEAIAAAGAEIDAALQTFFETIPYSAAASNAFIRILAIDLAAEYLIGRKCTVIPDEYKARADRARQQLDRVAKGALRVPGLVYPTDAWITERRLAGRPRVANPGR